MSLSKIFDKIERLIEHGLLSEALLEINDIEKNNTITNNLSLRLTFLKSKTFYKMGNYKKSLEIADIITRHSLETGQFQIVLDTFILKSDVLVKLGRFEEGYETITKAEEVIVTLGIESSSEILLRSAQLLNQKGVIHWKKGQLNRALDYYKKSLEYLRDSGNEVDHALCLNHIGIIFKLKGEFNEALKYYHESLKIREKIGNNQAIALSFNNIGNIYWAKGEFDHALEYYHKSLGLLREIGNKQHIAGILNNIGIIYQLRGEFDRALEYYQDSYHQFTETGNKLKIACSLGNIGAIYRLKGNFDQSLKLHQQSLLLRKEIGDKREIAWSLANIGEVFQSKGKLDYALEHYLEGQKILEDLESKKAIAYSLGNIGNIYQLKGEYERSSDYLLRSLVLFEEIGNKKDISWSLDNLGALFRLKGMFKQAINYLERSFILKSEIGNNLENSKTLFLLFSGAYDMNSLDQAREYLHQLQNIDKREKNKTIHHRSKIAEALLLKQHHRIKYQSIAQEIFEEIINTADVIYEMKVIAMLNMCDLLLLELKSSGNTEVLSEVKKLAKKLSEVAKNQNSYSLLAETYWLHARLSLLELDLNQARYFLTQAQIIAEEYGLQLLAKRISGDHDALLKQISRWESLIEHNASIGERLELSKLEKLLMGLLRKHEQITDSLPDEEPVLLLIINQSGINVFSRFFQPKLQRNAQLLSGFILAINTISSQALDVTGSLERIMHQEYTILLKSVSSLLICYAFKGQSYSAQKKFDFFFNSLKNTVIIWQSVIEAIKKLQVLNGDNAKDMNKLVDRTFLAHSS